VIFDPKVEWNLSRGSDAIEIEEYSL